MRSRRRQSPDQSVESHENHGQQGNVQQERLGNQGVLTQINQRSSQKNPGQKNFSEAEKEQIRRAFESMTDEAIEGSLLSLLSSFRVEQVMNCYARGDWTGVYHTLVGVVNFGRVMEALGLGARGLFTNPVGQAFGAAARVAPILGAIITSVEIGVAIYNMLNDARIAAHTSRLCPIYGAGVLATRILGQPVPEQSIRSFTYERLEQRLRNENEAQNTRNFNEESNFTTLLLENILRIIYSYSSYVVCWKFWNKYYGFFTYAIHSWLFSNHSFPLCTHCRPNRFPSSR